MPDIQIVQRRWGDVQVGDVVLDPRWMFQRWEKITFIEHLDGATNVWWQTEKTGRGYRTSSLELVEVQVEVHAHV